MAFNDQLLKDYIDYHHNEYVGRYRYRSHYQSGPYEEKYRYYMLDESFRTIEIFLDINYQDILRYEFSEDLHDREQEFLVKDALRRIIQNLESPRHLDYRDYGDPELSQRDDLTPYDYYNLLEYMKYHQGVSQKTIDAFYAILMPALERMYDSGDYDRYLNTVICLVDHYTYHYEWAGVYDKYYDCEYEYHVYYARRITEKIGQIIDLMYERAPEPLLRLFETIMQDERFSCMLMTDIKRLHFTQSDLSNEMMAQLKQRYICINKQTAHDENASILYSYIYALYYDDQEVFDETIKRIIRGVVNFTLCFVNHDLDYAVGTQLLTERGYEILLDIFSEDFNTMIFQCFPISTLPQELKLPIRQELEKAVVFFAARMENDKYRLSSFEQIMNINRLFLDNYREWYT